MPISKTNYMKPFVYRIMFVLSLLTLGFYYSSATTLGLGDIAFTGYNSDRLQTPPDREDEFTFVLLKDIDSGTEITFTDNGWLPTNAFRSGEGFLTIKFGNNQSCGEEFRIIKFVGGSWQFFNRSGSSAGTITPSGSFQLASSGDQIFAYQGTAPTSATASNWIAAIQMNCAAGCTVANWDGATTGSIESAKPSIFNTGDYSVFAFSSTTERDNGKYDCSVTIGDPASLRASINDGSNWSFNDAYITGVASFCSSAFSCSAACTDPSITSLTTNSSIGSNTFCPGDNVVITVNGSPGDATTWNLYTGSCGGTLESSTTATDGATFTINSIAATTTYYVGGTGGCVGTPNCTSITITVNGLTANAGSDQKISGSTTANLSGNGIGSWTIIGAGDGNGYFDGVPGTLTSNTASTTFNGTAGQQYELRWTVTNAGCANSSDEVLITFLSPTTLGLGDIAFTGYNSDNPDEFRFVLLKDINAGTQITFTDNGWQAAGGLRTTEKTITFEFCRPYSCGDEFSVTGTTITDDNANEAGTSTGSALTLATSGDQIFAYQGTAPTSGGASNWIAAIQMNGAWDANAVDAATSAQPSAFTDGVNSISISPQADNAKYNCSITTNSPANLRAAVNTASNWTTQEAILSLDYCSFTCGSCVEPVLTSVSAPATACPGQTVALTINGTLNGANEWAIYTGSCGGTLVGTTTTSSFNVTPTATTTYYVSGRGGCVVTESCQTATISVTSVQADAGPDQKISGATSATLAGNGSQGDGTWTFVDSGDGLGNITDDTDPASSFSGTAGQSYTLKWTIDNPNPCSDTEDEVTIVFLSQTTLTTGDIAFIAYSADDDDLAFVILKDINAGTTINFTDRGWQAAGGFRSGEGTITVEFCRPYSCGDEFNIFDATQEIKDASGQLAGTITGVQLDPATSGDQIFAYQGTEPTVGNESNFLAAIQMNGAWDTNATTSANSAQPSAFTDGVNSISFTPKVQNAYIDCSKVTLATGNQLNNSANWITSNSTSATLPLNCNLACCTPGVANGIFGSPGPLCPTSLQTLSVNGSLNDDQTWVWYTGSCGGTQVSTGPNFNVSPTVTTTYYVRAEGTCSGTTGACAEITITVEDNVPPNLTCPSNITVGNDAGLCSAIVNFAATASDNCGGNVDITYSQNSGTVFPRGTTLVNVTAEDESGKQNTCSFNVSVNDTEDPVAVCPSTIFDVELDLTGNGTLPANIGDGSSTDNCGTLETSPELTFTCADLGVQTVTLTANDLSGGISTVVCSFNVVDNVGACNQAPVANCKDPIVATIINTCEATITPADVNDGSSDPDGDPLTLSLDNSGPFTAGTHTVELTVSDGSLSDKCTAMVTVKDNQLPSFSNCPGNISVGSTPDDCGANVDWELPVLSDNCPATSSNSSANPGDFFPIGSTTVTYTGSDAAGNNAANCSFIVTVNDTEKPTIICPDDIMVDSDPNECGAIVNYNVNFSDNCPEAEAILNVTPASNSFFGVGTGSVLASVSDAAGNMAQCSFNVTVKDTEDPVIACPGDITVNNDPGECGAMVNYTVDHLDNCSDATLIVNPVSGSFFSVGSGSVLATVTDIAGNSAQCSFNVTVNDNEMPTFSNCPGNISVSNDAGDCGADVSWTPPTLDDNCPGAISNVTHAPGSFFGVGTTTVTYSGMDAAGNTAANCEFTVTVNDTEAPTFSNCPGNISVGNDQGECGADVNWTPPVFEDNCPGASSSSTHDPGDFFPVGSTVVTYSGSDVAGNAASNCVFTVTVNDTEAPVAVCKDVTVDFNGERDINLTVAQVWDEGASSDNCGTVEFVSADLSIGCEELGNTVAIPVTIQDGAGNVDDCTAYVDVIGLPCGWAEGPNDGSLNCDGQTTSDYDVDDESFTLTSDGCWHDCRDADRATYVYHPLCGDGTLTAKLASINTSGYAGLMARESLDPWARRAGVLKNYSTRRVRREWRASYGGIVSQAQSNRSRVKWLRIVRKGNEIKSYTSTNGSYWRLLYKVTFPNLEDCIYVGMTAYSLNGNAEVAATFEDVTFSGSGSLAGGVLSDNPDGGFTPQGIQAWGTVGDVGNGTIDIFPNPASNQAQIVLDGFEDEAAQLVVRDAFGKVVRQIDLDSAMGVVMPMEVQDLAPGVYLISLVQNERLVISKRLVIQK